MVCEETEHEGDYGEHDAHVQTAHCQNVHYAGVGVGLPYVVRQVFLETECQGTGYGKLVASQTESLVYADEPGTAVPRHLPYAERLIPAHKREVQRVAIAGAADSFVTEIFAVVRLGWELRRRFRESAAEKDCVAYAQASRQLVFLQIDYHLASRRADTLAVAGEGHNFHFHAERALLFRRHRRDHKLIYALPPFVSKLRVRISAVFQKHAY